MLSCCRGWGGGLPLEVPEPLGEAGEALVPVQPGGKDWAALPWGKTLCSPVLPETGTTHHACPPSPSSTAPKCPRIPQPLPRPVKRKGPGHLSLGSRGDLAGPLCLQLCCTVY